MIKENFEESFLYKKIHSNLEILSNNAESIKNNEKDNENFVPNTDNNRNYSSHKKNKSSEKDKNKSSETDKVGGSFIQGSQYSFDTILKSAGLENFVIAQKITDNLYKSVTNFLEEKNENINLNLKIDCAKKFQSFFDKFIEENNNKD